MVEQPADNGGAKSTVSKTAIKLAVVGVIMFAFVFVVIMPLYNVLGEALGINGTYAGGHYKVGKVVVDTTRDVRVQFVISNNEGMPWVFRPAKTVLHVHPGAVNDTLFYAKNPTSRDMVARIVPSFSPSRAAGYIHKTKCFCFREQSLKAGQAAKMPLEFIVDHDLPANIRTITVSYALFDVTEAAAGKTPAAARDKTSDVL